MALSLQERKYKSNGQLKKNEEIVEKHPVRNQRTGGHMCKKLKLSLFAEELIYKSLWAIAQIFLRLAPCAFKEKVWFMLEKYQFWTCVCWKQGENSEIPNKLLETMQHGYITLNFKGIRLLAVKLNLPERLENSHLSWCCCLWQWAAILGPVTHIWGSWKRFCSELSENV